MTQYSFFTWNMQRSPTSGASGNRIQRDEANQRLRVLANLCKDHDFGFITEAGYDIRKMVDVQGRRFLGGTWHKSSREGTQSDQHGCVCFIYSRHGAAHYEVPLDTISGTKSSSRYPSAGVYSLGGMRVLLISLHATSGNQAPSRVNVKKVIKEASGLVEKNEDIAGIIIGGDLNFQFNDDSHLDWDDCGYMFKQPNSPTNQGAHAGGKGIDGFYFQSGHEIAYYARRSSCFRPLFDYFEQSDDYTMSMPSGTMNAQRWIPFGYNFTLASETEYRDSFGFYKEHTGAKGAPGFKREDPYEYYRLSDHCPVSISINLNIYKERAPIS